MTLKVEDSVHPRVRHTSVSSQPENDTSQASLEDTVLSKHCHIKLKAEENYTGVSGQASCPAEEKQPPQTAVDEKHSQTEPDADAGVCQNKKDPDDQHLPPSLSTECPNKDKTRSLHVTGDATHPIDLTDVIIDVPEPVAKIPFRKRHLSAFLIGKLWVVLVLTFLFSIGTLVVAHLTHSLTLRVEAYHAFYNLLALSGCLISMRLGEGPQTLKNTFGWARVELMSCLVSLLFLAALCFGVTIDSIQYAAHAEHQDAMHHPLAILTLCAAGLSLNIVVFCLIGGYTYHQSTLINKRGTTGFWFRREESKDIATLGDSGRKQVCMDAKCVFRDISGLLVAMVCATVVYIDEEGVASLYIDPALAFVSVAILVGLSCSNGSQCGKILLQTIPGHIDVELFSGRLLTEFPDVVNVHQLHIWSLTPGKVIATAHVVFPNSLVYMKCKNKLTKYFVSQDITQVTLQPEFLCCKQPSKEFCNKQCLLHCELCIDFNLASNGKVKHGAGTIKKEMKSSRQRQVSVCSDVMGTHAFRTSATSLTSEKETPAKKPTGEEQTGATLGVQNEATSAN